MKHRSRPSEKALGLARQELLDRAKLMPDGDDKETVLSVADWLDYVAGQEHEFQRRKMLRRGLIKTEADEVETRTAAPGLPKDSPKLIIQVNAGVQPCVAFPKLTKQWVVTIAEWEAAQVGGEAGLVIIRRAELADEYARSLRHPTALAWVRTDWLWF